MSSLLSGRVFPPSPGCTFWIKLTRPSSIRMDRTITFANSRTVQILLVIPYRVILVDLVHHFAHNERPEHFLGATPECFAGEAFASFAYVYQETLDRVAFTDGSRQADEPQRETEYIRFGNGTAQTVDSNALCDLNLGLPRGQLSVGVVNVQSRAVKRFGPSDLTFPNPCN